MKMTSIAKSALALLLLAWWAQAGGKPKGFLNLTGSGLLYDKVEYRTYEELVHPLQQKLEKGKLDEIDFKVEEKMIPKGGVLAVEAKSKDNDPVVKVLIKSDTVQVGLCDDATSKPGLTLKFNSFSGKYSAAADEDNPVMTYECPFRTAFPDSFRVELVTDAGKVKTYRFRKEK
jgi:hypothetical protein